MRAEIIATGTELLLGEIVDTNSAFIAQQLAMLGIDHFYTSVVGDNYERMLGVLKQAWQRSDILITTGGLGPTHGDITREVIGELVGEKPEVNETLKQDLIAFFARLGLKMAESNIKQATLIPSATAMPNHRGTAPGWWVEKEGRIIAALPGPPGELQAMWQNEVLPRLEKKAGAVIISRTIKTFGLSESRVDELISPLLSTANPTLAIYAKQDGIHLRITAKAAEGETARKLISGLEASIREILKDYVWGADDDQLEGIVSQLLRGKRLTLAVGESFTGGLLSYTLASAPESASFFKGGVIAATDDVRNILGLGTKASTETAASMAALARTRFAADIGVGLDGLPGGEAFIAIDGGGGGGVAQSYRTIPYQLVRRATEQALFMLRKSLLSL